MNIKEMREKLDKAYQRTVFEDGGTYEEMYEAYQYAYELTLDVAEEALIVLEGEEQINF